MKRVKCKVTYEVAMWLTDREYKEMKEQADIGEREKELKMTIDKLLLEDRRNKSSKITEFYFGVDEEWQ